MQDLVVEAEKHLFSDNIEDFNTTFAGLELSVASYESLSAEVLLINAVESALEKIYPNQVEIVNL